MARLVCIVVTVSIDYLVLGREVVLFVCLYIHTHVRTTLHFLYIFMSYSLLWRHIVLLTVDVYSSNHSVVYHWNQYDDISKKCRVVRLSVFNANKKSYSSFIIDSRKIICISGERAYHPLQEIEAIFSKKYIFFQFLTEFLKN